jgi:two-component system, cell cycle sensor histidine kinase and response regulator CckA
MSLDATPPEGPPPNSPINGTLRLDAEARIQGLDDAAAAVFGRPAAEVHGRKPAELALPGTAPSTTPDGCTELTCLRGDDVCCRIEIGPAGADGLRCVRDITRESIERDGWRLVSDLSRLEGAAYLQRLVSGMAELFQVTHALIGREAEPGRMTVLACHGPDTPKGEFRYDLPGTPCQEAMDTLAHFVPDKVMDVHADANVIRELGVRSYYGVAIRREDGSVMGSLVIMSRHKLAAAQIPTQVLEALAAQTAMEMQYSEQQAELRRAEDRWQLLFEQAADYILMLDTQGRIQYVNRVAPGRSLDDVVGQDGFAFLRPEHAAEARKVFDRVLATGREGDITFAVDYEDATRWYEGKFSPYRENGEVLWVLAICRDISERRTFESQLDESRRRLEHIAVIAPGTLYQYRMNTDGTHRFEYVAPGAEHLLGLTAEEMQSDAEASWGRIHEADAPGVLQEMRLSREQGTPFEVEFRAWHKNGDLRWIRAHSIPENQPTPDGATVWTGIFTDVTASHATRSALTEHRRILTSVLSSLPGMVYRGRMTPDWPVDFVGGNVQAVLGCSGEDLTSGRVKIGNMVHKDDAEQVWNAIERAARDRKTYQTTYRVILPNGEERWCWEQGRVTGEEDGTPLIEGYVANVTDVHRLEEQLQQAQRLESVGRLAGGVAHDFNNLLTVILGSTEVALNKVEGPPIALELLRNIRRASEKGAALTRQLLTFARRQVVEPRVIELNAHLRDEESLIRRVIGDHIELKTDLVNSECFIRIDPSQLEQVLINLAVNSKDAMPDGGTLTLKTDIVSLSSNPYQLPAGRYVRFDVTDTGCGIEPEHMPRLWEPFFTTKPKDRGTGLGLPTCYGIIKQGNGHIEAVSTPGHGATFRIFLPLTQAPAVRRTDTVRIQGSRGSETVLLAEDNPQVRGMAVDALRQRGYRVLPAANGEAALRLAKDHEREIDIIVTDMVMPLLGGRQLVEAIQQKHPAVAVLYVSGYSEDEAMADSAKEGRANFLAKPFTPESLARRVREALDAAHEK